MTKRQGKSGTIDVKALLAEDEEFLRVLVRAALQEVLEAEMTEALGAEKGERSADRLGYRSGYYGRTLITRHRQLSSLPACGSAPGWVVGWHDDTCSRSLYRLSVPLRDHQPRRLAVFPVPARAADGRGVASRSRHRC